MGQVSARVQSEPDDMFACFCRLQAKRPNGRFLTFERGWGCYVTVRAGWYDQDSIELWDNKPGAKACEFRPLLFVPEVAMGRDMAACHLGGRNCPTKGDVVAAFGRQCCVRPWFRDCAQRAHETLSRCTASLPAPSRDADDYASFRAHGVLSCLTEHFRFGAVIELFAGKGSFLENFARNVIEKGGKIFTLDFVRSYLEKIRERLGVGTMVDVSYRGGPFLQPENATKPALARRVLSRFGPGLYLFPTMSLREANETFRSKKAGTGHYMVEPDNLLAAICHSLPPQTPTLVIMDAGIPLGREWSILAESCLDIFAVALFNTNHPGKVGYVRHDLLRSSNNWAEVVKWQEFVISEGGAFISALDDQVLTRRTASVLMHKSLC